MNGFVENAYASTGDLESGVTAALAEDPETEVAPEVMEQLQYEDLVYRTTQLMADRRETGGQPSPSSGFLKVANRTEVPLTQSLGIAVGGAMVQIYTMARKQGYEYEPDSILEAVDDLAKVGYVIAKKEGIVKDGPKSVEDGGSPVGEGRTLQEVAAESPTLSRQLEETDFEAFFESDGGLELGYDFSDEENDFLTEVQLEITKYFGQWAKRSGVLDSTAWNQYGQDQVRREAQTGRADDDYIPEGVAQL